MLHSGEFLIQKFLNQICYIRSRDACTSFNQAYYAYSKLIIIFGLLLE